MTPRRRAFARPKSLLFVFERNATRRTTVYVKSISNSFSLPFHSALLLYVLLAVTQYLPMSTTGENSELLLLHIRLANGGVKFTTTTAPTCTVGDLKLQLASERFDVVGQQELQQRVIYKGRILADDSQPLKDAGVVSGSTLILVSGAAAVAPDGVSTESSPASDTATPLNGGPDQGQQGNSDALTGVLQQLTDTNPVLRDLVQSNPSLRHMLSDPAFLRDMLQSATNPAARAHAERSHDLQLAQLENMPGGFAALSQMYSQIQEPLEESLMQGNPPASTGRHSAAPSSTSSSFNRNQSSSTATRNAGAAGTAMPNPWGSPSPRSSSHNAFNFGGSSGSSSQDFNPFAAMMNGAGSASPMGMMNGGGGGLPSQQRQALSMLEENPAMANMMQQFASQNPGMIRQMMTMSNHRNPAAAAMLQNMSDEQLQQMVQMSLNPGALRNMMQMEEQLQSLGLAPPTPTPISSSPTTTYNPWANASTAAAFLPASGAASPALHSLDFSNLLQLSRPAAAPPSTVAADSDDSRQQQVQQLREMGFTDSAASLSALRATNGNLDRAVDLLLSQPPPAVEQSASDADMSMANGDDGANVNVTTDQASSQPKDAAEKKND